MSFLRCDGIVSIDTSGFATCSVPWSQNADDLTALLDQLAGLNEFDPVKIALFVSIWLAFLITGFGVGLVIRNMRRL